jgi:hypothetical protein
MSNRESMEQRPPAQCPGIGIYLLLCALAALWIDLGTLHRLQHSDSLLPVLVSLQRWTPYFWEQDRYGMLLPLLARPLTNPFANLLFQGFLNVFFGLSAFFVLARYTVPGPTYPLVGALGAAAFLTLTPAPYRFDYLMDANYGLWLVLGLGSLIVIERRPGGERPSWGRWLMALVLVVLAHWVYGAAALYLGTLVALCTLFAPGFVREALLSLRDRALTARARLGRFAGSGPGQALLLLLAGFLAGRELTRFARHHTTVFAGLPLAEWPQAWSKLVAQTARALAPGTWPLVLGAAAGLVMTFCVVRARGALATVPWRDIAALTATAMAVALFMGTRRWLKLNTYEPRYLLPSALLIQCGLWIVVVEPCGRAWAARRRCALPPLAAALLFLSALWAYGTPSPRRVRADLDRLGALTPDLVAAGCTHLAGNYWTVWKTVFHANLTLYERGDPRIVWGVTFRGQPASELWRQRPQEERCVCIPAGDPFGDNWLLAFGFSRFRDVQRWPTVRVLRRQPKPDEPSPG